MMGQGPSFTSLDMFHRRSDNIQEIEANFVVAFWECVVHLKESYIVILEAFKFISTATQWLSRLRGMYTLSTSTSQDVENGSLSLFTVFKMIGKNGVDSEFPPSCFLSCPLSVSRSQQVYTSSKYKVKDMHTNSTTQNHT